MDEADNERDVGVGLSGTHEDGVAVCMCCAPHSWQTRVTYYIQTIN